MTYDIDNSNDPVLACAGKERFESMGQASRAANNINRKLQKGRTRLSGYRCPHCDEYHIGSQTPARLQRSRRIDDPRIAVSFSRGVK